MTGHVGGLPVEELLPTLISGGGAWLALRLTSVRGRRARRASQRGQVERP